MSPAQTRCWVILQFLAPSSNSMKAQIRCTLAKSNARRHSGIRSRGVRPCTTVAVRELSTVHIYIITKKSGSCSYSLPKPETETRGSKGRGTEVPNVPNPKVLLLAGDSETPAPMEVDAEPVPVRVPTLAVPMATRDEAAVVPVHHDQTREVDVDLPE